ncbi:alpha/beta fold hydrolase [Aliivibrio sp. S4TY2]|uniref:alpha/beta hydrolase n=1 Tax=unclassified Aliivibrio TaxID=2645654 RepID=UPI002379811C|nr:MULTISPECIES: alpha/beta fold hydrolase [unclassified Aliivibrio]MDD9157907.1 alpha/beta fold hydrolase [Aliivibrio sp. S4TY2]MDD9161876.1 alpha/beta fold hydrolase [Aliivibrio sp. S4TY1]MDD9165907.1 alpha/beta fold hydrolase [Aliivibrio sp. S4MY2]MDD9169906.1 alpha/beta fold hydrolase [Aliivibrio sp. S4MY4]MDD9186957.1 alpha/beta fold hydrolase [Aliivibrio sp. S4MY3]
MSQEIYFGTENKFSFKRSTLNAVTRLHHLLIPSHAKKMGRKLLLTPVRTKPKNSEPEGLIKSKLNSSEGELSLYQLGSGPTWVLAHGWSGNSSQFYPLMEYIASQGFTAVAFDHPAHGGSEGKHAHLPAFIEGLNAILDSCDDVVGVVAHSMGTAAVLECHHYKLEQTPLLLIAPVLNYTENLFNSIERSGYSMKLFTAIVGDIEDQYQRTIDSFNPYQRLQQRETQTIIVHDKEDRFTSFELSKAASDQIKRVTLYPTIGLGHGRVMASDEAKKAFDALR